MIPHLLPMSRRNARSAALLATAFAAAMAGCDKGGPSGSLSPADDRQAASAPAPALHGDHEHGPAAAARPMRASAALRPRLGLMTSLPLLWSQRTSFAELAAGAGEPAWQRDLLEERFRLEPLDTLTPIPALTPDAPQTDPLANLRKLAIIQPRGLSATDNAALDDWVRRGGELLLVLDPAPTGHYEFGLGDPRRPTPALIPPVVKRWGLEVTFDDEQPLERQVTLDGEPLPLSLAGTLRFAGEPPEGCQLVASAVIARCEVGEGRVTLLADAAAFEHRIAPVEGQARPPQPIRTVLRYAFD
ncbi:MAG: hypothetical protein V2J51_01230 [Erythrobacter sp.]|jgi:hypothetical protein|nr:hypothetical protein [Erythrobacter sp.]